jgi:serine/threonine-protein kinase
LNDNPTKKEAMTPALASGKRTLPSANANVPVAEGTMLADKYRVEKVLGRGGMGVVVAATHVELDQRVALKFLLPDAMENMEVVERFAREARAAVKIESEHVARVIDVGKLEDGLPYMVMEYLNGRDLAALLDDVGKLSVEDALDYVLQACEAIAQAHALGIIHRDLKPANLFVTTRPDGTTSIKVLDFGISKVSLSGASPAEMSLTQTAAIMGSPTYMSPEQMRASRDVDPRADIWALGVILYELLTGQPPFVGATMPELCASILKDPPDPVRSTRPDVPAPLDAAILRCLEKNPAARFANVAELAGALVDFAPKRARISAERSARILRGAGVQTASLPPIVSHAPRPHPEPIAVSTATAGTWTHAPSKGEPAAPTRASAGPRWVILGGVAMVGVAGFFAWQMRAEAPVASTTVLANPSAATSPAPAASESIAKVVTPPTPAAPASGAASAPVGPGEAPAAAADTATAAGAAPKAEALTAGAAKARAKPVAPVAAPAPPKATTEPPPTPSPAPTRKNPLSIEIK